MEFKAFKMDGLGNDFVIIDQRIKNIELSKNQIVKICDRKFIGCDQLIIIKKKQKLDAFLEFYNSDGSSSGACGNGTRCVAYFLSKENDKKEITVETSSGILKSIIHENRLVETEIGKSKTIWNEIPINKNLDTNNLKIEILDKNNEKHVGGTAVNVGNPHIVFFVDNVENFDLKKVGPKIENHELFPNKCNLTLAKIINKTTVTSVTSTDDTQNQPKPWQKMAYNDVESMIKAEYEKPGYGNTQKMLRYIDKFLKENVGKLKILQKDFD